MNGFYNGQYNYVANNQNQNGSINTQSQNGPTNTQSQNGPTNNSSRCEQRHVHEIQGSVMIAEPEEEPHNHRFATVSGEAIGTGLDHYHEVQFRTDFFEDHYHEFSGVTSPAVIVGDRHVHFLESVTTENDGHRHDFRFATLIDNPIGCEY